MHRQTRLGRSIRFAVIVTLTPGRACVPHRGQLVVARYSVEGTLDPTFGSGGRVTTDFGITDSPYDLELQPDGRILLAGSTDAAHFPDPAMVVARYWP